MIEVLSSAAEPRVLGVVDGALAAQLHRRGSTVTASDNWGPAFEIARR